MYYLMGENDLRSNLHNIFVQLKELGSSDDVRMIVLYDSGKVEMPPLYTGGNGIKGVQVFAIGKKVGESPIIPLNGWSYYSFTEQVGEENQLDLTKGYHPKNREFDFRTDRYYLEEFVEAVKAQYPADRYMLVIGGHGTIWLNGGTDGNESFKRKDLQLALQRCRNILGQPIDILCLDMCLQSTIEVVYELTHLRDDITGEPILEENKPKPALGNLQVVKYLVAPEQSVGAGGMNHKKFIEDLKINPYRSNKEIAESIELRTGLRLWDDIVVVDKDGSDGKKIAFFYEADREKKIYEN